MLCEHNPHRRCNVNFAPKYLVNDVLKAKCDAPIRVEIIDRQTGVPLGEDIADVHLEVGAQCLPKETEISACSSPCLTCQYVVRMCSMYRMLTNPFHICVILTRHSEAASSVQYSIFSPAHGDSCLQMCILDGNAYDAKCLEAGQERDEDLEACSLLINNKQQALLVPSAVASHSPTAKVVVQLTVRLPYT